MYIYACIGVVVCICIDDCICVYIYKQIYTIYAYIRKYTQYTHIYATIHNIRIHTHIYACGIPMCCVYIYIRKYTHGKYRNCEWEFPSPTYGNSHMLHAETSICLTWENRCLVFTIYSTWMLPVGILKCSTGGFPYVVHW